MPVPGDDMRASSIDQSIVDDSVADGMTINEPTGVTLDGPYRSSHNDRESVNY